MPDPNADLRHVAENVGPTSRKTCGGCHFQGGGGDAVKHGDMSEALLTPTRNCDVHMGGYGFECADCHKTANHKIPGKSTSVSAVEGEVSCESCHTETPHYGDDLLDHHLNKHCETVACNTCHTPVYSKCSATKTWWDWSKAGDKNRKPVKGKYGLPDYNWKKGEFKWKESAKPEYAWYGGFMKRVLKGDKVDLNAETTNITEPVGSINDPNAKIYPFKVMRGVQAVDGELGHLLIPHLFPRNKEDKTAYWKNTDWQKAFADGMKAAELEYSGNYKWQETAMYWGIEHEVMPASMALSCAQCHESLTGENSCNRCHQDSKNIEFKKLIFRGTDFKMMKSKGRDVGDLEGTTDYIDFRSLGYEGDPIIHGGRFKKLPLGVSIK